MIDMYVDNITRQMSVRGFYDAAGAFMERLNEGFYNENQLAYINRYWTRF